MAALPALRVLLELRLGLFETWFGGDISTIPLEEFAVTSGEDSSSWRGFGDYPGPHCLPEGGMHRILPPLLASIPAASHRIHYGSKVNRIVIRPPLGEAPPRITVETEKGDTWDCAAAVVTVPLGVLQVGDIAFCPPLPRPKQAGLDALATGSYKKVWLAFPSVFWNPDAPFIVALVPSSPSNESPKHASEPFTPASLPQRWSPSNRPQFLFMDNLYHTKGIPALELIFSGRTAEALTGASDAHILQLSMACLRETFGDVVPHEPDASHISRWEEDPLFRGAYSFSKAETPEGAVDALADPVDGVLFFAGEATDQEFQGSVHAALLSGQRVASQVQASLRQMPTPAQQSQSGLQHRGNVKRYNKQERQRTQAGRHKHQEGQPQIYHPHSRHPQDSPKTNTKLTRSRGSGLQFQAPHRERQRRRQPGDGVEKSAMSAISRL
uniref:Amine oxidase domain-containing protein n=1 Tax=Rhizochromulina marina TaxID=1034831 RepID=A0A7S2SCX3_9STRA